VPRAFAAKTNKMKNILNRLINHEMLTAAEAKRGLGQYL
jgi:hypothetical protein